MTDKIGTLLLLIPALPLAAAIITALLGPRVLKHRSDVPTIVALVLSFGLSVLLLLEVGHQQHEAKSAGFDGFECVYSLWTWADVEQSKMDEGSPVNFEIEVTLRADALTAIMLAMVTFVSSLVAIFAVGYMHGDRGYWRFFSYISLFVFSMTMLVSVSNFLLLYVFWEAVGVCSYLLIGFWYEKTAAAAAGVKAFLVNRVGDFGFALAIFLIWTTYGTLNFHDAASVTQMFASTAAAEESGGNNAADIPTGILSQERIEAKDGANKYVAGGVGMAICLLLMLGACGKSAQFPLHVWLPDAMEGPTPVSALIHAATMVTAGVYMVTRCTPLFLVSETAQIVVACIGGFTALLAALIALTQFDLKRVLAYSTISQLGYMFLALGTGTLAGITAGMFHLFTHAFFKALLFLGAGSVMHAMGGVIDMRRFGGLRRLMPITYYTFLIGCLALAGVVPFAGFWSKDEIIAAVQGKHAAIFQFLFVVAIVTALLTAFYTFRAFFLTFWGDERVPDEAHGHAHESPPVMAGVLVVLAICAVVVGFALMHPFGEFLRHTPSLAYVEVAHAGHDAESHSTSHTWVAILSTIVAFAGIGLAAFLYLGDEHWRRKVESWAKLEGLGGWSAVSPHKLSWNKFYFDEIYGALVVWPMRVLAIISSWWDRWIIDGLVNLVGRIPVAFGWLMRSLQMGLVPFYALAMVMGVLILLAVRVFWT